MEAPFNSLGLNERLDDVKLSQNLALSFGVRFGPDESAGWRTVGDIYRSIADKLIDPEQIGNACASAMAFRKLRRAILRLVAPAEIRPETPLRELATFQPRRFLKRLGEESGLRMPDYATSIPGLVLMAAGLLASVGLTFGIGPLPVAWPYAMLALACSVLLPLIDPGRFPRGCRTVGELTEKVAGLNYARMRSSGAASDSQAVWRALVSVVSEHTDLPADSITPATTLADPAPGDWGPISPTVH
ncbi:MAG: hypothetical protein GC201_02985 [Alphaproteobacteria bacterium]|nr:hypothetical protein [Alphaproteobacteria bacterium]